jgi:hypothetical protein
MRTRALALAVSLGIAGCLAACNVADTNPARVAEVAREEHRPERYLPDGLDTRPDSSALALPGHFFDLDEEGNKDSLPSLPYGMTLDMIRDGDRIFHGKGGCVSCHGSEGQGLAARGKSLTAGLHFLPPGDWHGVDSLVSVGMPDAWTRSAISMPPRGQHEDLSAAEIRAVAAYVWAISEVKSEPWQGGHAIHAPHDWRSSARTAIP